MLDAAINLTTLIQGNEKAMNMDNNALDAILF